MEIFTIAGLGLAAKLSSQPDRPYSQERDGKYERRRHPDSTRRYLGTSMLKSSSTVSTYLFNCYAK